MQRITTNSSHTPWGHQITARAGVQDITHERATFLTCNKGLIESMVPEENIAETGNLFE